MKRIIILSLFLFLFSKGFSQGHQLNALILDLPDGKVYLSNYSKTGFSRLDSSESINGAFYFHIPDFAPPGMYRLDFEASVAPGKDNRSRFIEFIWADETFEIFGDYEDLAGSVSFENSIENNILGEFRSYENLYEYKMGALYNLLDTYPEEDDFFRESKRYFLQLQQEREAFLLDLARSDTALFVSKLIRSYRSPLFSPDLRGRQRIDFLKQHYFDAAAISVPELLYAPVYNRKIIEYLKLYRDPELSFGDQEEEFIHAVDMIMANVSGDPDLRNFAVEYLLEGFESFGMEKIQTYIVDTYADETCTTDVVELAFQRVKGYRKMEEGQIAADILIRGLDNKMVRLSETNADYTLVLFWATYCEHCTSLMPKLLEWYSTERPANLEIFAVSIDTSEVEWRNFMSSVDPPWVSTIEPMGWKGKSAEDYNVYATPTMFLLDRQRKILAKPYTFRELKREVSSL